MDDNKSISQTASVVPLSEQAAEKRSIQTKMFLSDPKAQKARVALAFAEAKTDEALAAAKAGITLGQLIGNVMTMRVIPGRTLPNGDEMKESLLAVGEFEGTVYDTGEVFVSTSCYLPGYYAESIKAILDKDATASVAFAVEIVLVPTGKDIPVAYEVRNLIQRRPDNPLNALKAELQRTNRLRLPPPAAAALSAPDQIEATATEVKEEAPAEEKKGAKK